MDADRASLTELYESKSSCVVAFINRIKRLPEGSGGPIFPDICGTGFLINREGLVVTNRHVVDAIESFGSNPKTGERAAGAVLLFFEKYKGCHLLNVDVVTTSVIDTFSSNEDWYGQPVPDIGFVQLKLRETPFLELATEDFAIRPGMEISTIGYPMGTTPLTLHAKVSQISPFVRRGIVSSVYPFPMANPHGFTIDVMQQGGSSGSPIFGPDNKRVVGMMWGVIKQPETAVSGSLSLNYLLPTNISLAESAHIIEGALKELQKHEQPVNADFPTLQERRAEDPMPNASTGLTWESWPS
jgi:S1-C subfamily serine protease